jgi:hypothetical protein
MCFSAEASFAACGVLAASSIGISRIPKAKGSMPLSLIPAIFATHQFVEGVLWLNHDRVLPDTYRSGALDAYVLIAYVLWPIFVPFCAYWTETERKRRLAIVLCEATGLGVGLSYLVSIVRGPIDVWAGCCGFSYRLDAPDLLGVPYLAAVSIPFLLSSCRSLVFFGIGVVVSFGAAAIAASTSTFPSVWCYFAALLSGGLYLHFKAAARTSTQVPRGSLPSGAIAR